MYGTFSVMERFLAVFMKTKVIIDLLNVQLCIVGRLNRGADAINMAGRIKTLLNAAQ